MADPRSTPEKASPAADAWRLGVPLPAGVRPPSTVGGGGVRRAHSVDMGINPRSQLSRSVDTLPHGRPLHPAVVVSDRNGNIRNIHEGPIVIGVCAMEKKAKSGPMSEILNRITTFRTSLGAAEFRVQFFSEALILSEPIEQWPLCEALIAFFSTGFPLRKVQAYAALRRPHVFNDLEKQEWLFDRRRVYTILRSIEVPTPKFAIYDAKGRLRIPRVRCPRQLDAR